MKNHARTQISRAYVSRTTIGNCIGDRRAKSCSAHVRSANIDHACSGGIIIRRAVAASTRRDERAEANKKSEEEVVARVKRTKSQVARAIDRVYVYLIVRLFCSLKCSLAFFHIVSHLQRIDRSSWIFIVVHA